MVESTCSIRFSNSLASESLPIPATKTGGRQSRFVLQDQEPRATCLSSRILTEHAFATYPRETKAGSRHATLDRDRATGKPMTATTSSHVVRDTAENRNSPSRPQETVPQKLPRLGIASLLLPVSSAATQENRQPGGRAWRCFPSSPQTCVFESIFGTAGGLSRPASLE